MYRAPDHEQIEPGQTSMIEIFPHFSEIRLMTSTNLTSHDISLRPAKVINLGFSKTGTTTFEHLMKTLGYSVAFGHWKLNYCYYLSALCICRKYNELIRFTRYFDVFSDAPWGGGH